MPGSAASGTPCSSKHFFITLKSVTMSHALYQYDVEHCPLSEAHSVYMTSYELLLTRARGNLLLQTPIEILILQDL